MSGQPVKNGHLLARVNYPIYVCRTLSERHLLVAGGGGSARTGIANTIEIYELIHSPKTGCCFTRLVTRHDTGFAVMNCCVIDKSNSHYQVFCGGFNGVCRVFDVQLVFLDSVPDLPSSGRISPVKGRERTGSFLRRRRTSSSSPDDIESDPSLEAEEDNQQVNNHPVLSRKSSKPVEEAPSDDNGISDFTFEIKLMKEFQTDFAQEPYQKVLRCSMPKNLVVTGGDDGHIRVWNYPGLVKKLEIKAHKKEVDDIDISPNEVDIVSLSRDECLCRVWRTADGQQKAQLEFAAPKHVDVKFLFRSCRFGIVEGDANNFRLFTLMNPKIRTKPPVNSYICKWNPTTYSIERVVDSGKELLSVMSLSDDGRFVGVGTLNGEVFVYIAFSLKKLYKTSAHNSFVTDVEFLKTCPETQKMIAADNALVSVSIDNHIVVHQIPHLVTLGFLGSTSFFIIFMLVVYLLMNFLGL